MHQIFPSLKGNAVWCKKIRRWRLALATLFLFLMRRTCLTHFAWHFFHGQFMFPDFSSALFFEFFDIIDDRMAALAITVDVRYVHWTHAVVYCIDQVDSDIKFTLTTTNTWYEEFVHATAETLGFCKPCICCRGIQCFNLGEAEWCDRRTHEHTTVTCFGWSGCDFTIALAC